MKVYDNRDISYFINNGVSEYILMHLEDEVTVDELTLIDNQGNESYFKCDNVKYLGDIIQDILDGLNSDFLGVRKIIVNNDIELLIADFGILMG